MSDEDKKPPRVSLRAEIDAYIAGMQAAQARTENEDG